MKDQLFSVAAGGHERLLMAPNGAVALKYCLDHDDRIAEAEEVVVKRRTDVVDVTHGKAKASKPQRVQLALPATDGGAGVPDGMITVKALAEEEGLTIPGMRYRLKKAGVEVQQLKGVHGQPMAVKERIARFRLKKLMEKEVE